MNAFAYILKMLVSACAFPYEPICSDFVNRFFSLQPVVLFWFCVFVSGGSGDVNTISLSSLKSIFISSEGDAYL